MYLKQDMEYRRAKELLSKYLHCAKIRDCINTLFDEYLPNKCWQIPWQKSSIRRVNWMLFYAKELMPLWGTCKVYLRNLQREHWRISTRSNIGENIFIKYFVFSICNVETTKVVLDGARHFRLDFRGWSIQIQPYRGQVRDAKRWSMSLFFHLLCWVVLTRQWSEQAFGLSLFTFSISYPFRASDTRHILGWMSIK